MLLRTFTSFDIIITNNSLENFGVCLICLPLLFSAAYWSTTNRLNSAFTWVVNIVADKVKNAKGRTVGGLKVYVILLFIYIIFANRWGLLPYILPVTRHMSVSLS